eukprot:TRINITY_DN3216_c0_g1_i1.p1 TRINITY_DN3216_c0_g1~~TRINITY_DN3216_c0_g1_i1.p1  ORF type:complete len:208 (-),score=41.73 TRINITY_DN3216_c0_g1_i1:6-629(-)
MGCGTSRELSTLDTLQVGGDRRKRQRNLFKVVLLGDSAVGKTCLLRRFVRNDFSADYKSTIGADFLSKELTIDGRTVTLQIWDTAGQERFHSLGVVFYRGAEACCLVCDVSDRSSLDSLSRWRREFCAANDADDEAAHVFMMLANKCDVDDSARQLSHRQLADWWADECPRYANELVETSALRGVGVDVAFSRLAELLLKNAETADE